MKMTNADSQVPEREKWVGIVGRFILAFGDIENVTYMALLQLPKDRIFGTTSKLGFGARVDLVLEIVSGHKEVSDDLKAKFSKELLAAKALADTRNLVAHSPLMMTIYSHPKEEWAHSEMALGNVRNKESGVSFDRLNGAADQAEALAKALYHLYGEVHKQVLHATK